MTEGPHRCHKQQTETDLQAGRHAGDEEHVTWAVQGFNGFMNFGLQDLFRRHPQTGFGVRL